ncbi:MAG: hypothetical protein KGZ83_04065 [Sulfuricella sp.]|nr:hypothetical protein [Sulfuricella sp.]
MKPKQAHSSKFKTITCFLPVGRAQGVLESLRKEKGVASAYASHARGSGLSTRRDGARPEYTECEMITALVPAEQADEVFRFVFFAAGIDHPHAGMVIMMNSPHAEMLELPGDIPDET